VALPLEPAGDLEPVEVGQHHVQDDQRGVNRPGLFHGLGAIEGALVLESSDLNVGPYQLIDLRVIFDDEHGPSIFRH